MPGAAPPAYAWDWLARQRIVWQECRRRLIAAEDSRSTPGPAPSTTQPRAGGDVPDWSSDHPDLLISALPATPPDAAGPRRDYRALGTRAEAIAALRLDYPVLPGVRSVVDAVVTEVAFLGRLDVSPAALGVRSVPRGMQWWWSHLSGRPADTPPSDPHRDSEPRADVPLQLRLVDVLAGYGDAL
jgi:hypothetical protein